MNLKCMAKCYNYTQLVTCNILTENELELNIWQKDLAPSSDDIHRPMFITC
jgi:hypothetical protein